MISTQADRLTQTKKSIFDMCPVTKISRTPFTRTRTRPAWVSYQRCVGAPPSLESVVFDRPRSSARLRCVTGLARSTCIIDDTGWQVSVRIDSGPSAWTCCSNALGKQQSCMLSWQVWLPSLSLFWRAGLGPCERACAKLTRTSGVYLYWQQKIYHEHEEVWGRIEDSFEQFNFFVKIS
jgi:hypothetical protein